MLILFDFQEAYMRQRPILRGSRERLPLLVFLLCLIQPFLDVLSYWMDVGGFSNRLTLILRLGLLAAMVLLGFLMTDRRRSYYLTAAVLGAFTLAHMLYCRQKGYLDPIGDLTNLVRIYQLPLTALAFVTFLKRDPRCLEAVKRGFVGSLLVILAVELLSVVTKTNPCTYANKSIGVLGWFSNTSSQSAILSMLVPVAIAYTAERKNYNPFWILGAGIVFLGMLYFYATRLTYAALFGTVLALALTFLVQKWTGKVPSGRAALALILCACLALGGFRLSPMYRNNQQVAANKLLKQRDIDAMVAADRARAEAEGLTGQALEQASLRSAYETYLPGPTGRFGLARTAEVYGNSTDAGDICDVRREKRNYNSMLLEEDPGSRIFGIEWAETVCDGRSYDAENDFHGIYYLCGAVGLALLLLFLAGCLVPVAWSLVRGFKTGFTLDMGAFGTALICCLAHVYFTSGVLRRPNAAFYMGAILATLLTLSRSGTSRSCKNEVNV